MKKAWTAREIAALRKGYATLSLADLTATLQRSTGAIRRMAYVLGLRRTNRWVEVARAHVPARYSFWSLR